MTGTLPGRSATAAFASSIETPSGKDVAYENFPVGSWLLPAALRPHIAIFYAFARAADDIADSPDLAPEDKVARLDAFEAAVCGRAGDEPHLATARRMRESLATTRVEVRHCVDLLTAFRQDATKLRYRDWDDLIGYCLLSAAPVGRYLLDLHGGSRAGYAASDALCMGLQVINHLQDCRDDYRQLDRIYLPQDWMHQAGARVEDLDATTSSPALRQVIDLTLDGTERLLATARALPAGLISRRLAMESGAILAIADRLVDKLRRGDPLGPRIELGKSRFLWCCLRGAIAGLA
ncbi:squalene synthase HpnC [Shumkonia mesophila]|uniref:squalene synthase HpnC n=1 Tax=Shumkonia mesophila TaxID=2838854 RepID=UPI0029349DBD|nr:squalene synthase HpnC [Shumkonia mesophila]